MRIVHLVDGYPPSRGGMERAVQALAQSQAMEGHDVRVVALATPTLEGAAVDGPVRVLRVDGHARWLRPLLADPEQQFHPTVADRGLVSKLSTILRDEPADIVHAHGWIVHSAMAAERGESAALVHTLHDYGLTCATKTMIRDQRPGRVCEGPSLGRCLPCSAGFYGAVKGSALAAGTLVGARRRRRRLFPEVDMFLPISEAVAALSLEGVEPERVRIVPSSVPDDVSPPADAPPAFLPEGEFVLFVGQLGRHKGIDVLLAAHRAMRRAVPLVVIGPPRDDTPELVGSPTRPVHRFEDLDHATIMRCFAAATVSVVPSQWAEPMGLVAVESMAAGTPVVVSDVGGLSELVEGGRTGVIVPPGSVAELASALDALMDDPARRQELAQRGRRRAVDFSASAVLPAVLDAYTAALRNRGGQPSGGLVTP